MPQYIRNFFFFFPNFMGNALKEVQMCLWVTKYLPIYKHKMESSQGFTSDRHPGGPGSWQKTFSLSFIIISQAACLVSRKGKEQKRLHKFGLLRKSGAGRTKKASSPPTSKAGKAPRTVQTSGGVRAKALGAFSSFKPNFVSLRWSIFSRWFLNLPHSIQLPN